MSYSDDESHFGSITLRFALVADDTVAAGVYCGKNKCIAMAVEASALCVFFCEEPSLVERGENAVKSNHVMQISYDDDLKCFTGVVQASMKNRSYAVEVSRLLLLLLRLSGY